MEAAASRCEMEQQAAASQAETDGITTVFQVGSGPFSLGCIFCTAYLWSSDVGTGLRLVLGGTQASLLFSCSLYLLYIG